MEKLIHDSDVSTMDCEELIENICEFYNLDENTCRNLTFSYHSHTSTGKTEKVVCMSNGPLLQDRIYVDDCGIIHLLFIDQIKLEKHIPAGTLINHDVSCKSKFMLESVNEIRTAIRKAFHFVDKTEMIYLVLDNAGGHGTAVAKEEFVRILRHKHIVKVIWQVPNSPDTNLLNLGAWCTIQSEVEEIH